MYNKKYLPLFFLVFGGIVYFFRKKIAQLWAVNSKDMAAIKKMAPADQVKEAALNAGCSEAMAKIIVAQSKHESAYLGVPYNSNVYKKALNCYGMKMPRVRPHPWIKGASTIVRTSEGSAPYAEYESAYHSTRDLIDWLTYSKIPLNISTVEEYAAVLKKKGYYGDSQANYLKNLTYWYSR